MQHYKRVPQRHCLLRESVLARVRQPRVVVRRREAHRWLEGPRRRAQRAVELQLLEPGLVVEEREAEAKRLQLSVRAVPVPKTEAVVLRTEMEVDQALSLADWIHRNEDGRKNAESFRFEFEERHSGAD